MQVSAVGVTGARSNVNLRVEHLLREIKKVRKLQPVYHKVNCELVLAQ
jgi:tryptophan synthase alpha subunit